MTKNVDFVYFGGEPLGVPVLEALLARGLRPRAVVTNPDRKSGRGRALTAPPTKVRALEAGISVLQPTTLDAPEFLEAVAEADLFVVVAYNKILPEAFLSLPKHGTLNVHPSMLPLYRGPSPVRSAIRDDSPTGVGVSVILLDALMDHGPLIAQEAYTPTHWPIPGSELEAALAERGGQLLADVIPAWVAGELPAAEQDHAKATYTKKFTKDLGELHIDPHSLPHGSAAQQAFLAFNAYDGWPGSFFFHNGTRFKITQAHLENDTFVIDSIVPEGKKEAQWRQYFS